KKLFLVRHGESEWNVLKRIQGQQNVALTDRGKLQARLIAKRLLNENIDSIYSSDLDRAYNTAVIIGNMLKIDVNPMPGLREIDFGKWEGISYDNISDIDSKEIILWRKAPEKLKVDGAETLEELQLRAMSEIYRIMDTEKKHNVLIVSHSATLKTIILGLLDMKLSNFKNITLDNVGLTIIEFRDYNRVLKLLNDTNHLKGI
ncbi:MAG TPA: histidine phosphatase family protein, partial [Tepidimicrobium sp.]|nr:histidine phosphatase family protein [Tepidimicrobium sp.]